MLEMSIDMIQTLVVPQNNMTPVSKKYSFLRQGIHQMTFSEKMYLKSFKKDWEGECNVAIGSPSVT